jgi:protein-tyrosine phosphatase
MNEYYTFITPDIAIGELNASYDSFDTVVNLAYINPTVNNGLQHGDMVVEDTPTGRRVIRVGVYDSENDAPLFYQMIINMMPYLRDARTILFHCQAGKSRSVCMALAYLCKKQDISVETGLQLIKDRRPIINPRPSFVEAVTTYLSYQTL